ncbi:MAG: TetR/AcrR family transcriptional regulator [Ignavibacteria bacterium]|nr:TetR/AcrR family transcriptional regulator [Ignavibacteria bacterium]
MGTLERKEREKEQRREEIFNAARRVFFQKGLQAATMDEIAEAAELSKGTLYLYHKSKEDLYLAVMVRGIETLREMFLRSTAAAQSTVEHVRGLAGAYFEFFERQRNYFRMFNFFEHPEFHKQVSEEMLNACSLEQQKIWKLVIDILERGIKEGVFRSHLSSAEIAITLWLMCTAILVRIDTQADRFESRMHVNLRELYRKSSDLLLESIMTEPAKQRYRLAPSSG